MSATPNRRKTVRIAGWSLGLILLIGAPLSVWLYGSWLESRIDPSPPPRVPKNAPYIPSPQDVVDRMLALADLDEHDVVWDLGCGDGRIVITAAQRYGCRGIGFEFDPELAEQARANVLSAGVEHLVSIQTRDIFTIAPHELNEASVLTLYLLPWMNQKLEPQLAQLADGKTIVSHEWDLPGFVPDWIEPVESQVGEAATRHRILKWTTPLRKK